MVNLARKRRTAQRYTALNQEHQALGFYLASFAQAQRAAGLEKRLRIENDHLDGVVLNKKLKHPLPKPQALFSVSSGPVVKKQKPAVTAPAKGPAPAPKGKGVGAFLAASAEILAAIRAKRARSYAYVNGKIVYFGTNAKKDDIEELNL